MPSPAQTQLLDKLKKIRVPQKDIKVILTSFEKLNTGGTSPDQITQIIKNFDRMAGGIIGGVLAPEQVKLVVQKIVDDASFRTNFIKDYKGALKKFAGTLPDR